MANPTAISPKIIWLLVATMLLLTLMSAANLYLTLNSSETGDVAAVAEEVPVEPKEPIFVTIGPLTVNLSSDTYGQRLLYTGLSLRVEDEESREQLEMHRPEVHSRLLLLLSEHRAEDLTARGGKEKLKEKVLALFQEPLAEGWSAPLIDAVLFTDFIVQ